MHTTPGLTASTPGVTSPPTGFLLGILLVFVVFYLAVFAWGILTLVGLVRGSSWARVSILIIGGCLVALGLISVLGTFALQMLWKYSPPDPNSTVNPAIMHVVVLAMAVVWLGVAVVGVWWLVYFNLRATKEFFAKAKLVAPPTPYALDFTYAQPALDLQREVATVQLASEPVSPTRQTPLSMKIIGWLMIFGALICLLNEFVPIPLFFLGVMISGWAAHIFLAVWLALSAYVGYGLLRLKRPAWLLAVALFCLGIINAVLIFSPAYRNRMLDYTLSFSQSMNARMGLPQPQTLFDQQMMGFSLLFGAGFSLVFFVFLFVLLWRARWAYEPGTETT
jgi:hypothetical protein